MKILKQIWLILNRKEKTEASGLFFLLFIGACLEVLGVGLILPYLALINNPDLINKSPLAVNIFHYFNLSSTMKS